MTLAEGAAAAIASVAAMGSPKVPASGHSAAAMQGGVSARDATPAFVWALSLLSVGPL